MKETTRLARCKPVVHRLVQQQICFVPPHLFPIIPMRIASRKKFFFLNVHSMTILSPNLESTAHHFFLCWWLINLFWKKSSLVRQVIRNAIFGYETIFLLSQRLSLSRSHPISVVLVKNQVSRFYKVTTFKFFFKWILSSSDDVIYTAFTWLWLWFPCF